MRSFLCKLSTYNTYSCLQHSLAVTIVRYVLVSVLVLVLSNSYYYSLNLENDPTANLRP